MYFHKNRFCLSITFIVFFAVSGISVSFAQPENILLNHDAGCFRNETNDEKQRSAVMFPHELHMEQFECLECHHVYEDGENVLDDSDLEEGNTDISCCSCHNSGTKIDLEYAFHNLCMSCHNENRKKFWVPRKGIQWKAFMPVKGQSAPTLCGECHVQEKQAPSE